MGISADDIYPVAVCYSELPYLFPISSYLFLSSPISSYLPWARASHNRTKKALPSGKALHKRIPIKVLL